MDLLDVSERVDNYEHANVGVEGIRSYWRTFATSSPDFLIDELNNGFDWRSALHNLCCLKRLAREILRKHAGPRFSSSVLAKSPAKQEKSRLSIKRKDRPI